MATPHVAGLASLLKGFNTDLANDDIEQIIRLTADDRGAAGFDNSFGAGRINAQRALQSLQAPNQLFHWNVTGGTVFTTTNQELRTFLGFPGLSDAVYLVRRSEVRANVIFPTPMCNMIGAWGRGVGTTGYREERNISYGEGICEIVPGTLTNTGATLRTWIYEVWAINGQYLGFYPNNAQNTVFQYTVLGVPTPTTISGENIVCTTSNNYTIPGLPAGAIVQWQVSPAGLVTINAPNSPQTTITKNGNGVITLTAIISNVCGEPITISKQSIVVGTPSVVGGGYVADGVYYPIKIYSIEPLRLSTASSSLYNELCVGHLATTQLVVSGASNISWTRTYAYPTNTMWWQHGNEIQVYLYGLNQTQRFRINASNACGTFTQEYAFRSKECSGGCSQYQVSPNPATNDINIVVPNIPPPCKAPPATLSVTESETKTSVSDLTITEVKLYDNMGLLKKVKKTKKVKQLSVDVSDLKTGTYFIEITDGTHKETQQLVIQK